MNKRYMMRLLFLSIMSFLNTLVCNNGNVPLTKSPYEESLAEHVTLDGNKPVQEEQIAILPSFEAIVETLRKSPHYLLSRAEKIDEWADILLDARRFDSRILESFAEYTSELLKNRLVKGVTLLLRFDTFPFSEFTGRIIEQSLSLPSYLFQAKYFSGKALKGVAAITAWLANKIAGKKLVERETEKVEEKLPSQVDERKKLLSQLSIEGAVPSQEDINSIKNYIIEQEKRLFVSQGQNKYDSFFAAIIRFGDAIKDSLVSFFGDQPESYKYRLNELESQEKNADTLEKVKELLNKFNYELATLLISFKVYSLSFDIFVPDESLSISDSVIAAFEFMNFKRAQIRALQIVLDDFKQGILASSGTIFEPMIQDAYNKIVLVVNKASTKIVGDTLQLGNDVLHLLEQWENISGIQKKEESRKVQQKRYESNVEYKKLFEYSGMRGLSVYEKALKDKVLMFDSTQEVFNALVDEFDAIERGGFSTLLGSRLNFFDYSVQLLALEQLSDFIFTERFGLSDSMYNKDFSENNVEYESVENLTRAIKQRIDDIRAFVPKKPLVNNKIDHELRLYEKIRRDKISALKAYILNPAFAKIYPIPEEQFNAIISIVELMKYYSLMSSDLIQAIKKIIEQKKLIEDTNLQKKPYFLWLRLQVAASDAERDFILQEEFVRIRSLSHKEQKERLPLLAFFVYQQKNKNIYLEHLLNERIKQLAHVTSKPQGTTPLGIRLRLENKLPQDQGRLITDYLSEILNQGVAQQLNQEARNNLIAQLKDIKKTLEVYNLKKLYEDLFKFIDESIRIYSQKVTVTESVCQRTTPRKSLLFSLFEGTKVELPSDFFSTINRNELKNYMQNYIQCSSDYLLKNAHSLQDWGVALQKSQQVNSPVVALLKKYGDAIMRSSYFGYLVSVLRFDAIPYSKDFALYLETFLWSPGSLMAVRQIPGKIVYGLGNLVEWFARKINNEKSHDTVEFEKDVFQANQKALTDVDELIVESGVVVEGKNILKAECEAASKTGFDVLEADKHWQFDDLERIKDFIKNQQGELLLSLEESRYKNFFKPLNNFGDSIKILLQTKFFGPQADSYLSKIAALETQSFDNEYIQQLSKIYQEVVQECNALIASFKFYISLFESFVPDSKLSLHEATISSFELINFKLTQMDVLHNAVDTIKQGVEMAQGSSLEFIAQDLVDRLSILVHEALVEVIAQKVEICKNYSNYLQIWADELK